MTSVPPFLRLSNAHLEERGLLMREGTLVDATIINAPSSTKNKDKARDPEIHQTKKGNQWYFGMKAHIGTDRDSGIVHTVVSTAGNVSDISQTGQLLHGQETQVHADAEYVGVEKREEITKEDPTGRIDWQIAKRRGSIKKIEESPEKDAILAVEKAKASVRAFVEHPFHILKNLFRHRKTRYPAWLKIITIFKCSLAWATSWSQLANSRKKTRYRAPPVTQSLFRIP